VDTLTPEPQDAVAPTATRACETCGEPLVAVQEWCLQCGHAQSGRLGAKPGWRAATTIVCVVVALVLSAVAASYAALSDDAAPAVAVAPLVAAAPPVAAVPPPPAPTATATATTATENTDSVPAPALPPTISTATPPPTAVPTPTKTIDTDTTTTDSTKTTDGTKAPEITASDTPGLQEIVLGTDAASVYDPYKKVVDQTDPADSYDDKPNTTFTIQTAPGATMGVGIDFDLDTARAVRAVEVHTSTPGFDVEVYGAKGVLPIDILDPGWAHLTDQATFGAHANAGGRETLRFAPGKYRHVLLWFTTPPPAAADADPTAPLAIGITQVRLLD